MKQNVIKGLMLLLAVALAATTWAGNLQPKFAPDLAEELDRGAPAARVIVTHDEEMNQDELRSFGTAGPQLRQRLSVIQAVSGEFSRDELNELAANPRVLSISPDRRVIGSLDVAVTATGSGRLVEHLGLGGNGVTVQLDNLILVAE